MFTTLTHKKSFLFIFITMMFFNIGCFYDSSGKMIYIVSKTLGSKEKLAVPDKKFQAILSQAVFRANRSTLDVLNQQSDSNELRLTRMSLGLELELEAGIKNVADVAAESTFELRFERLPAPKHFD